MLQNFLSAIPAHLVRDMWYQQDGVPGLSTIVVLDYLIRIFGTRRISRVGPPRSRDLSPIDFFFLGSHEGPYVRDLHWQWNGSCCSISGRPRLVRDKQSVFENVWWPMQRCCEFHVWSQFWAYTVNLYCILLEWILYSSPLNCIVSMCSLYLAILFM